MYQENDENYKLKLENFVSEVIREQEDLKRKVKEFKI